VQKVDFLRDLKTLKKSCHIVRFSALRDAKTVAEIKVQELR
jgi:hypothetical protein